MRKLLACCVRAIDVADAKLWEDQDPDKIIERI
jgi:hypothetical protein